MARLWTRRRSAVSHSSMRRLAQGEAVEQLARHQRHRVGAALLLQRALELGDVDRNRGGVERDAIALRAQDLRRRPERPARLGQGLAQVDPRLLVVAPGPEQRAEGVAADAQPRREGYAGEQ